MYSYFLSVEMDSILSHYEEKLLYVMTKKFTIGACALNPPLAEERSVSTTKPYLLSQPPTL